MIYVLAQDPYVFRSFCQEFQVKVTHGGGGVAFLHDPEMLSGLGHNNIILVAYDGKGIREEFLAEVRARCEYQDIPLLFVPDLVRARFMREKM
jgi:hypothetical protein